MQEERRRLIKGCFGTFFNKSIGFVLTGVPRFRKLTPSEEIEDSDELGPIQLSDFLNMSIEKYTCLYEDYEEDISDAMAGYGEKNGYEEICEVFLNSIPIFERLHVSSIDALQDLLIETLRKIELI